MRMISMNMPRVSTRYVKWLASWLRRYVTTTPRKGSSTYLKSLNLSSWATIGSSSIFSHIIITLGKPHSCASGRWRVRWWSNYLQGYRNWWSTSFKHRRLNRCTYDQQPYGPSLNSRHGFRRLLPSSRTSSWSTLSSYLHHSMIGKSIENHLNV